MADFFRRSLHQPDNDINILLLGATGVGKTTFINAFINFLFYNTLDEAMRGDFKVLIPSSFSVTDNNKDEFDSRTIAVGNPNNNENMVADGASSTQSCRSYVFQIGTRLIRLIDGPGVGDTRGVDHEARNFDHILRYITQYEHLNGICILLKPTETRLNIYVRYCFKELLRHLNVSAKDNLMFVFTSARTTFYRPGDTVTLVRRMINEIHQKFGVEIPFNKQNTFMFDNESFRFLAVYQQGLDWFMKDKKDYSDSWEKSVAEYSRLITRICECDLHAVQDTQSLNEAQILIQKLSRPIAEIASLIQENISLAQQYKQKLRNNQTQTTSARIPQKVGKFVPLRERLTVCVNVKCTEVITIDGEQRINYKSHCHVGCSLNQVVQECIGHPIIRRCRALMKTGFCRKCGCEWTKHMHISYRYDHNLTQIDLNDSNSARTPQSIDALIDKRVSDLKNEEAAIRRICVQLTLFLKANAITPFNDDMLEYLKHFIGEEKRKQGEGKDNAEIIRGLEQMVEDYNREINLFTRDLATTRDTLDNTGGIDRIFTLVAELYQLPINGKFLREQITKMKEGRAQTAAKDDQYVELPSDAEAPKILRDLRETINRRRR